MKIVFSRKGFDSGWGGKPSPILPDGRLVSLPIPDLDGIAYSALRLDDKSSYADLMADLGITAVSYPRRAPIPLDQARAHLDPDLDPAAMLRLPGWRPAFGQVDRAQGHLRNQQVGPGDLFCFFGWFRPVIRSGTGFRYAKGAVEIQALWGYLEIGEVLSAADTHDPPAWAAAHPHFALRDQPRFSKANTVYVATERLSWDLSRPGGGMLSPFRPQLQLTKVGATPSVWDLPIAFHPDNTAAPLTGNLRSSWSIEGDRAVLRAARIGQEFVVQANDDIKAWLSEVFAPATATL